MLGSVLREDPFACPIFSIAYILAGHSRIIRTIYITEVSVLISCRLYIFEYRVLYRK